MTNDFILDEIEIYIRINDTDTNYTDVRVLFC